MLRIIILLDGGQRQAGQLVCSINNPEISMLKPILRSPTRQILPRSNQSLNNHLLLQLPLQLLQQHQQEPLFNPLEFHHIKILETQELHPLDHLNHLENLGETLQKKWSEAKFKEFEPCLKFERVKHGSFYLKLYSVFRDLSRRSIGTGFRRFSDAV